MEKLASLLKTKDWEEVTERRDDYTLMTIYEFCDVTEREIEEFVGDDYVKINAEGDVIYKWFEDEEFVYAPKNVFSYGRKDIGRSTLRRFKKSMVSSILSTYRVEGEEEEEES